MRNILWQYKTRRKFSISFLLLILYISSEFKQIYPYLDYYINYDYISTVLCINKEKEELKCDGKCYLRDQVRQDSMEKENPKKTNSTKEEKKRTLYYYSLKSQWPLLPREKLIFKEKYNRSLTVVICPVTPPPEHLV